MLADAFPSPPGRPGKYVLYISRRGDREGLLTEVHIWAAPYAALKFLELVLGDGDFIQETSTYLRSEWGINVRCDRLQEVLDHDYTVEEAIWQMPQPHRNWALRLRGVDVGASLERVRREADGAIGEARTRRERRKAGGGRSRRVPGMVDIGQIARELSMEPREARGILRKKVKKPAGGWQWKAEDVDSIKAILQRGK